MAAQKALPWTGHRQGELIRPHSAFLQGMSTREYISQRRQPPALTRSPSRLCHTLRVSKTSSGVHLNLRCLPHVLRIAVYRYGTCARKVVEVLLGLTMLMGVT